MSPNIKIQTLCNLVNCSDLDYQYFQIMHTQNIMKIMIFKKYMINTLNLKINIISNT